MLKTTFWTFIGVMSTAYAYGVADKPAFAATFNVNDVSAYWSIPGSGTQTLNSIFWGEPVTPKNLEEAYPNLRNSEGEFPSEQELAELFPIGQRPNFDPNTPIEMRKSGLSFEGGGGQSITLGVPFLLGELTHFNNIIRGGSEASLVSATIDLNLIVDPGLSTSEEIVRSFAFELGIEETKNFFSTEEKSDGSIGIKFITPQKNRTSYNWKPGENCKYIGRSSCPDRIFPIRFLSDNFVDIQGVNYTLGWLLSDSQDNLLFEGGITNEGSSQAEKFYVLGILFEEDDLPPEVEIGTPLEVDEGDEFSVSAQSDSEDLLYTWDLDGDDIVDYDPEDVGTQVFTSFAQDRIAPYPIRLRVDDGKGQVEEFQSDVIVRNVAPEITFLTGDLSVLEDELFQFSASAFDPGIEDILAFDWDFNGDSLFDDFTGSSGEYSFAQSGTYPISLRVSDGDGGEALGSFNVNVAPVPEPSQNLGLIALSLAGLARFTQQRQRRFSRTEK